MSFSATGRRVPRSSKPKDTNPFRRSSSSLAALPRSKPSLGPKRKSQDAFGHVKDEQLDDIGIVRNLAPTDCEQDVIKLMRYIQGRMFCDVPERASGMNSTRTAEVLNYRRRLPLVVTTAHLHALSVSATNTEREVVKLIQAGRIRRINVLGRGRGGAALGEGLVLVEDWIRLVRAASLDDATKHRYILLMTVNPTSATIRSADLTEHEAASLTSAGFLTSTSVLATELSSFLRAGAYTSSISTAGSRAPSGTLAAVGGYGAVHESGGGGGGLPTSISPDRRAFRRGDLTFSLPSTGPYLKLLTEARTHLIQLLTKSSPQYKEAPRDLLREKWDGNVASDDAASRAKKARGEFAGLLPGATKKWKSFYGLEFEWVLEECLGAGLVECFDTGSVGLGVRVTDKLSAATQAVRQAQLRVT
ncbi:hypothetical protein LTR66_014016 [Elasticomyces elasticus]|nr:hypothetical protein LTR66_014016 [Elasticomyces elasticus]